MTEGARIAGLACALAEEFAGDVRGVCDGDHQSVSKAAIIASTDSGGGMTGGVKA